MQYLKEEMRCKPPNGMRCSRNLHSNRLGSQNLSASNLQENHSFHGQFLLSCRFSPRSIHRIRNLTMFSPFVPYMFHRFPRDFPAISPCVPHRPGSTWPVPRWPWAAAGRRTGHCRRPRGWVFLRTTKKYHLVGGLELRFIFPYFGNNHPQLTNFFGGVETTNQ